MFTTGARSDLYGMVLLLGRGWLMTESVPLPVWIHVKDPLASNIRLNILFVQKNIVFFKWRERTKEYKLLWKKHKRSRNRRRLRIFYDYIKLLRINSPLGLDIGKQLPKTTMANTASAAGAGLVSEVLHNNERMYDTPAA